MMLGMPKITALVVTTLVLLGYVTLGGAHADILTDVRRGSDGDFGNRRHRSLRHGDGFSNLDALLDSLGRQIHACSAGLIRKFPLLHHRGRCSRS